MNRSLCAVLLAAVLSIPVAGQAPKKKGPQHPALKKVFDEMREFGGREGRLKPGDAAPDFDLQYQKSTGRFRLSSFRGRKPVALVFGSYT